MRHLFFKKLPSSLVNKKGVVHGLLSDLIFFETIRVTLPQAKSLRPFVEKLITRSKKNRLIDIRHIMQVVKKTEVGHKLLNVVSKRYSNRSGGYTRIIKDGFRKGDNAPMAIIQLV